MGNEPYEFVTEIPIGGEGGWDILTIDPARRSSLSRRTRQKLSLSTLVKTQSIGEIADTPGVHAIRGRARSATRFFIEWQRNQSRVSSI